MQGVFGIFIGTFLIGLREGLEATLIVSIVGAFLKRNGQSTRPMFAGVALAVLISCGVGVGLVHRQCAKRCRSVCRAKRPLVLANRGLLTRAIADQGALT